MNQPQHGILYRCFFGTSGLRAGWRLLIFAVLSIILTVAISIVACILVPALRSQRLTPFLIISQEGLSFLCLLAASWVMARIERRRVGDYGLPWQEAFRSQFLLGVVIGFASLSLLLGVMRGCGTVSFGNITADGSDTWVYGASYALAFLAVGLFEEFFSFGYVLFTLFTGIGYWKAALLVSAVFASLHIGNPGETWIGILNTGLSGMLSCLILRRTGNLWMAVGNHAAWDWGQSYVYGVANSGRMLDEHLLGLSMSGPAWLSGGSVGPEGSILCTALLVSLWFLIGRLFPTVKFPLVCKTPEPASPALDSTAAILEISTEANSTSAVTQLPAPPELLDDRNEPRR
jgi:uncharacterized protein